MTIDRTRQARGTSDPLDFRNARPVGDRASKIVVPATNLYGGNLATNDPGTHFVNGDAVTAEIAIAGALLVRLRGKFTGGGTLSFKYLRPGSARNPDSTGAGYSYSTALDTPHADVAVVANTEFLADIEPGGESDLLLTFTPSADGVVTFLDVMQQ
jgi:hypothetical protein